ncbi:MAG: RnfABCDGE type electron transport complex subunit D, partial [Firmicutes bacterium]|nr:RnfABCDGE type electron transport complex subunit D [Bacillota bacterium]
MSNYKNNLVVSSSPHVVTALDTRMTMLMVIIALVPSLLVSVYVFGPRVLLLTCVSMIACMFFEWLWNAMMKRESTVGDLSAALTGMLIAFNVPAGLPIWILIIGDLSAIIVVKQLFGGLGK